MGGAKDESPKEACVIVCMYNTLVHFRFIQLVNGIRLLLVSTAGENGGGGARSTSAAALDVRVGSFNDPVSLQGLCHLCEHVLFTGSETYPNESYGAFLGKVMQTPVRKD